VVFVGACSSSGSPTSTTVASTTSSVTTTTTAPAASAPIDTAPRGRITIETTTPPTAFPTTTSTPGPRVVPAFAGSASTVTAADLPSSYHAGCPVGPTQLRALRISYWGFDDQPHTGTMIVNASVVGPVLEVFGRLYAERFPIRRMQPVDVFGGSDPASMAADNTSAFNCRDAVVAGPPRWSAHAYGEAIDVNTVENPYVESNGANVQPPAGTAFLDRSDHRAGMAFYGGELVAAFAAVGWQWGGRWSDPDYQHFSSTGG
jgi:hypothetical protein